MLPIYRFSSLKTLLTLVVVIGWFFTQTSPLFAQTPATSPTPAQPVSSGVATMITINEKDISEGDIITFTDEGYKKSAIAYDSHVYGVVTQNPQVVLESTDSKNAHAVISLGKVYVKVSNTNGNISTGDLLTTSKIPGVAQKSDQSGYVLGTAMESYSDSKPGLILVVLNIGFNTRATTISNNLIQQLKLALSSPEVSPVNALRYLLAVAIVIIAFVFGIAFFGKVSASGVEAIGRNPLASRLIMLSMLFHLSLALVIILVGIAIAYLVLIL